MNPTKSIQFVSASSCASKLPEGELRRLQARFPARLVPVGAGVKVEVRECGEGPAIICLHGIGSGAASWLDVAERLASSARVIAWDAPGYGHSTALIPAAPWAVAYADRLRALVRALEIEHFLLVGHSLGALMAAAATNAMAPAFGAQRLVLIAPARGYGAPERVQEGRKVRDQRLDSLAHDGIEGMATFRSRRLLSPSASERDRTWVRWNMAALNEAGYLQAVELLCGDDIFHFLPPTVPVRVLCGSQDVVTSPASSAEVALACGVSLELIDGAGHACYVEKASAVAGVLLNELQQMQAGREGPSQ